MQNLQGASSLNVKNFVAQFADFSFDPALVPSLTRTSSEAGKEGQKWQNYFLHRLFIWILTFIFHLLQICEDFWQSNLILYLTFCVFFLSFETSSLALTFLTAMFLSAWKCDWKSIIPPHYLSGNPPNSEKKDPKHKTSNIPLRENYFLYRRSALKARWGNTGNISI